MIFYKSTIFCQKLYLNFKIPKFLFRLVSKPFFDKKSLHRKTDDFPNSINLLDRTYRVEEIEFG